MSAGRPFYKMSGSGNDFVFFDCRTDPPGDLEKPARVVDLCARGTGVGADGVVFLHSSTERAYRIRYYNSDGSLGTMCGNASLCSVRLVVELGLAPADGFEFESDAGVITARVVDGLPEIALQPVTAVSPEYEPIPQEGQDLRLGFADPGVPHVVILVPDIEKADVTGRGARLRAHPSLQEGANVDFLARTPSGWAMRTFERGVEAETLACGTGAVASAIMLAAWGESGLSTDITTRSGCILGVRLARREETWLPSLRGQARIVFEGNLREG